MLHYIYNLIRLVRYLSYEEETQLRPVLLDRDYQSEQE